MIKYIKENIIKYISQTNEIEKTYTKNDQIDANVQEKYLKQNLSKND